jgi:hypothetical protein
MASYLPPIFKMKNFSALLMTSYGPRYSGASEGATGGERM